MKAEEKKAQKTCFVGEGANAFSRIEQALDAARMERGDGDIVIRIRGCYQVCEPVAVRCFADLSGFLGNSDVYFPEKCISRELCAGRDIDFPFYENES